MVFFFGAFRISSVLDIQYLHLYIWIWVLCDSSLPYLELFHFLNVSKSLTKLGKLLIIMPWNVQPVTFLLLATDLISFLDPVSIFRARDFGPNPFWAATFLGFSLPVLTSTFMGKCPHFSISQLSTLTPSIVSLHHAA